MMIKSDLNSLEAYNYELPENLIATKPANLKRSANLLIYNRKSGGNSHMVVICLRRHLVISSLTIQKS